MNKTDFVDAQQMAIDNPETFEAPSMELLRDNVTKGSYVKVCTEDERFWVKVTLVIPENTIYGLVANDLITAPYKCGEEVIVEFRHIYEFVSRV